MIANIRLLPDGTGRVRIHWFDRQAKGPLRTVAGPLVNAPNVQPFRLGGAVGRIACMPQLDSLIAPIVGGNPQPITHTDDALAATCPECCATKEFKAALKLRQMSHEEMVAWQREEAAKQPTAV